MRWSQDHDMPARTSTRGPDVGQLTQRSPMLDDRFDHACAPLWMSETPEAMGLCPRVDPSMMRDIDGCDKRERITHSRRALHRGQCQL